MFLPAAPGSTIGVVFPPEQRDAAEKHIATHCEKRDYAAATTEALETYGAEIFGYLVAVARNQTDASEAFAMFSEDLWRGIAKFQWKSSLRTWAYTVARNALHRLRRAPDRQRNHRPLSQAPEIDRLAAKVRTRTLEYLRTEVKDKIAELRAELDPDDQTLFILRLSRQMSWNDIARVMASESNPSEEMLKRSAVTLRKRFDRAKRKLTQLARERNIVPA